MLADSTQLGSLLPEIFTEEMAYNLDNAILTGSGVGMPLGILNSGALITVAKENNQAAKTITYANVLNMWARLTPKSRANAVWYYNIDAEPQIYTMYQATGATGVPVFTPAGVTADGVARLFGRPMIPIEQASTLGTVGDLVLADMSKYRLIEKGGIDAQQSIHVRFLYGENTFRFVYRANGKPMPKTAITPAKGSNTLSPFVTLATRA